MRTVLYSDPIPTAQAHYQRELRDVLASTGWAAELATWSRPVEGGAGVRGKVRMLINAVLNVGHARRVRQPLIQLWPSLGMLEARLWASTRAARYVIVHDPTPLRRQYGHSRRSRRWASRARVAGRPTILVQSALAEQAVRAALPHHDVQRVLHPITAQQRRARKSEQPTIVIAGQFKPARNLPLLAELGPRLRARGWQARIIGRGWPAVPGWEVDDRFVPESEMDDVLASAWVFLLAYHNYFQSGVAVRALENGTPTVGESTEFLIDLLGQENPGLVRVGADADAYETAIERVLLADEVGLAGVFRDFQQRSSDSWRQALLSEGAGCGGGERPR